MSADIERDIEHNMFRRCPGWSEKPCNFESLKFRTCLGWFDRPLLLVHAVVAGGSSAKVLDLTGAEIKDISSESVELPIGQTVFSVAWSPDGQLLTVSTTVRCPEASCHQMMYIRISRKKRTAAQASC